MGQYLGQSCAFYEIFLLFVKTEALNGRRKMTVIFKAEKLKAGLRVLISDGQTDRQTFVFVESLLQLKDSNSISLQKKYLSVIQTKLIVNPEL